MINFNNHNNRNLSFLLFMEGREGGFVDTGDREANFENGDGPENLSNEEMEAIKQAREATLAEEAKLRQSGFTREGEILVNSSEGVPGESKIDELRNLLNRIVGRE